MFKLLSCEQHLCVVAILSWRDSKVIRQGDRIDNVACDFRVLVLGCNASQDPSIRSGFQGRETINLATTASSSARRLVVCLYRIFPVPAMSTWYLGRRRHIQPLR